MRPPTSTLEGPGDPRTSTTGAGVMAQIVAARVASTNASRAQFLGCAFAVTFALAAVGDAVGMGTLRQHGFMAGQVVAALATAAIVRWTRTGRRHGGVVFVVGMSVVSASGAAHLAQFGGLDGPHFYGVYTAAPILIPMLIPLPVRVAGTIATIGAFVGVYAALRADLFAHPMAHIPVTYLVAIGAISVATGRYIQRLEEGNFVDVARLEAAATVLDAQLRGLEAHPTQLRHEIARQLHDDVAQLITGARLHLDGWSRRRAKDEAVARLSELLDELAGRARHMLEALRAPVAPGSVIAELARLREDYGSLGLAVEVVIEPADHDGVIERAHVEVVVATTREALTNALRHGGASEATVSVQLTPHRVELEVWDDGGGRVAELREGYGLLGIRERAARLGGEVRLADYEEGLRLSISLPRPEQR